MPIKKSSFNWAIISIAFATLLGVNSAHAEIEFEEPTDDGGTLVAGDAKKVSTTKWPATRIFASEVGGCTTTLVGTQALLTAAHCVDDGASAKMRHNGTWVNVTFCSHHPSYDGENSFDYALCKLGSPVLNVALENVNTSRSYPRVGHELALLGYGCISDPNDDAVTFANTNRSLYGGVTGVVQRPSTSSTYIKTSGGAGGCFGDSGGAAYIFFSSGRREIVGVMSRALVASNGIFVGDTYISSTSNTHFINWAEKWISDTGAKICGISLDAKNCKT